MGSRLHRRSLRIALATAWAASVSVPLAMLSAAHHAEIRSGPTRETPRPTGTWELTHILVESCPCSKSIAAHLISRNKAPDANEQVWVAESGRKQNWVEELDKAGFDVRRMPPQEIVDRVNVEGGPWLIIHDPLGERVYSGGYQETRPGSANTDDAPHDLQLLAQLRSRESVSSFRALGCGMGESLFQPLGLKCDSSLKEKP